MNASHDDVKKSVEKLIKDYPSDVDVNIVSEIKNFLTYVKEVYGDKSSKTFVDL